MATTYTLGRDANGGTTYNVSFTPSSLANARLFAQGMADIQQRIVVLEYFDPNNGAGVVKETYTPAAPTISDGVAAIAAGSYVKTAPAGTISAVRP